MTPADVRTGGDAGNLRQQATMSDLQMMFHALLSRTVLLSAWLAIILYTWTVLRLARETRPTPIPRFLWSLGCAVFLTHVVGAFDVYHHWSHAEAVEKTRVQSLKAVGVEAGWGIYVNYLFTAAWVADLAWWWKVGDERYRARKPAVFWLLHGFFLSMIFFGGFVFVDRNLRWLGLGAFLLGALSVVQMARRRNRALHPLPS